MDEPIQVWRNHSRLYQRLRKSLYFGGNSSKPLKNSLPLTECTVDFIQNIAKHDATRLGDLDVDYASHILKQACFPPAMPAPTLIIAMIYLERLKSLNSDYLHQTSPSELFLVSLVVASKFLFDRGEDEIVYNDEWASFGNLDLEDLNRLEREFLGALDWSCFVDGASFEKQLSKFEGLVSLREFLKRRHPHMTYTELLSLCDYLKQTEHHKDDLLNFWTELSDFTTCIGICSLAYAAALSVLVMSFSIVFSLHLAVNIHQQQPLDTNSSSSGDNFTLPIAPRYDTFFATDSPLPYHQHLPIKTAQIQTTHFAFRRNLTSEDDLDQFNYQLLLTQKSNKILKCS